MWYQNICSALFGFVAKHACDRRTDRQSYDSQDRAGIAARAVKSGVKPVISIANQPVSSLFLASTDKFPEKSLVSVYGLCVCGRVTWFV